MKNLFTLSLILLTSIAAYAQPGGGNWGAPKSSITGKITGKVMDSNSGEPVEYATVVLTNEFQKQLDGTLTNNKGQFKLPELKLGKYFVKVSFVGYNETVSDTITLTKSNPDFNLDKISLESSAIALEAVTVSAEKSLFENKIDKVVYNAEKDITNKVGDATDVLRKTPLLSVDLDGNVELRGSRNIQILLNGRPSGLFANSVKDALKSIPSDQIKSVEVITSPSAKYDGEGSAGIINIITKKKSIEGISGSVNTALSNRTNNTNLSLSAAKGRFGISGGGYGWLTLPRDATTTFDRTDDFSTLTTSGVAESTSFGYSGNFGAFYDLNAYNTINSTIRFNGFQNSNDGLDFGMLSDSTMHFYNKDYTSTNFRNGYDWSTDYIKKFENPDQELVLAYQLNVSNSISDEQAESIDSLGNWNDFQFNNKNENLGKNVEQTVQLDYTHPFSKKFKLETGAKAILRDIDSDYTYQQFNYNTGQFEINNLNTDLFFYDQDVFAGYVSTNITLNDKYSLLAGVRYEHTLLNGEYESEIEEFGDNYGNILPSVTVARSFGNFTNLKLSYSQRIQRPSLFYINPYASINDPTNVQLGNPGLSPELSKQVELGYSTFVKGTLISLSAYYKNTEDIIESYLQIGENGNGETTFRNVGVNNSIGLSGFTSVTIKKVFTIRGGFNAYTYNINAVIDGQSFSNQAILWNGNINASWKMGKGWNFQAFGFYNAPKYTFQGINPSFSLLSMGIQKDLFNEKGAIGLRVLEPFKADKEWRSELSGPGFTQNGNFILPFRSIGLSFSVRFGKVKFDARSRRTKIRNDDAKAGDSGNGGAGF